MEDSDVIKVYKTLHKVFADMPENDEHYAGFKKALYLLKVGLSKCPQLNSILKIRSLNRQIQKLELTVNDLTEDMIVLRRQNKNLRDIINDESAIRYYNDGFRKVQFDINGYLIEFYSDITQEQFDVHLQASAEFALSKRIKKYPENTIRCRLLEYFRQHNFKCKT